MTVSNAPNTMHGFGSFRKKASRKRPKIDFSRWRDYSKQMASDGASSEEVSAKRGFLDLPLETQKQAFTYVSSTRCSPPS